MKAPYPYCPSCSIFHDPDLAEDGCIGIKAGFQSAGICLNYKPMPVWRCEFVDKCVKAKGSNPCLYSKPRLQKSHPNRCEFAEHTWKIGRGVVDTLTGGE